MTNCFWKPKQSSKYYLLCTCPQCWGWWGKAGSHQHGLSCTQQCGTAVLSYPWLTPARTKQNRICVWTLVITYVWTQLKVCQSSIVPFSIVATLDSAVARSVDFCLSHFWIGIQNTATAIILFKYVPLIAVPAGLQWHGTCSGHQKRSPWSEAVAGRVSEPASNPPDASHPADFAPQPLLSCPPSPSPRLPSCPREDHLNKMHIWNHGWNNIKKESKQMVN